MKNAEEITHCIQRIALNDSQVALKELYTYYFYDLLRYSMLYTSNPRDAEEVVSDTFFMVWNNRALHIENQSIDNIAIDIFAHTNITPEDELISQEEISEINLAINSLPNKCKIAFKLVKENHLKYKEAAEILNISVKTLEAHLTTAMKKIREKLKDSI